MIESGQTVTQGDQIGQIFASWAMVFVGQFFSKLHRSHNFRLLFSFEKLMD
jgi:hypothetical protein